MEKTKLITNKNVNDALHKDHYMWLFSAKGKKLAMHINIKGNEIKYTVYDGKVINKEFDTLNEAVKFYNQL